MSQKTLVLLGDSHFLRLQDFLKDRSLSRDNIINLSVSGSSVEKALANLNEFLDENKTKLDLDSAQNNYFIFIFLGSNDCRTLKSESQFNRRDFNKIVTICKKIFKNVRIVKIPPIPKFHEIWGEIDRINKYIASFSGSKGVKVVETFRAFPLEICLKKQRRPLVNFQTWYKDGRVDGIHLNDKGFSKLWRLMKFSL